MKRNLFFTAITVVLLSLAAVPAMAQRGAVGLGLRATPDGGGFTGKFFASRNLAIEVQLNAGGVLALEGSSFNAVGLLEYHIILPNPSWSIFFGGGIHAGVWDHDRGYYGWGPGINDKSEAIFGIDGIGGVEYRFKKIPLGLSADIKPAVNFVEDPNFFPHNMFGIAARFYL